MVGESYGKLCNSGGIQSIGLLSFVATERWCSVFSATERGVGGHLHNTPVTCNSRGVPPVTRNTHPDVLYSFHGRKVKGRAKSEALDK